MSSLYRRQVAHGKTVARKKDATLKLLDWDRDISVLFNPGQGNFCAKK